MTPTEIIKIAKYKTKEIIALKLLFNGLYSKLPQIISYGSGALVRKTNCLFI